MKWFRQMFAVTDMNIRSIRERVGSSLVVVIGIAGSVSVMVSLLAMAGGLRSTVESTGDEDRAIVLRSGSNSELSSSISREEANVIGNATGLKTKDQSPMVSFELYTVVDVKKKGAEDTSNLPFRGVQPMSFSIRPELKIIEGRNFEVGRSEIIVGRGAYSQFEGLEIGNSIKFRSAEWTVVGIFSSGGDVHESEVMADLLIAQSAFNRGATSTNAIVRLEDKDSFDQFAIYLENEPRLEVKVERESEYYKEQGAGVSALINVFGYLVASIMAVGSVFAALNSMYSAVSTRLVEIGTLRALGFQGSSILGAVMIESMFLALLGGLLGAGLSYIIFNGYTVSTLAGGTFSQTSFDFAVTLNIVQQGLFLALLVGFLGGFFPAWKAAREDITSALRSL
ncbi:MAG: ABC transporter permease [SAR86 cluster bacterium]|nr:ABC transporter permease [SAR86 cluster bacterium]